MSQEKLKPSVGKERYSMSKMSYFSKASALEQNEIDKIREVFSFYDGQRVPMSPGGEVGFYYIHEGFVLLVAKGDDQHQVIRVIGPGDLAGFSRWRNPNYNYSMVTRSHVVASFFKKEEFLKIQEASPYLTEEVTRWLVQVLGLQEEHMFILKRSSALIRVGGTLLLLSRSFGNSIGGNDSSKSLPIDRKTLADLCGVTVEVLSRTLSSLENQKIIERRGRRVTIVDKLELQTAVYGD